ncbi:MAG: hemolysin D [Flavobacteriales bacterium CG03_land_8_20_14_0_80_35_15]|nr:hemolysin III family protein [Zetaproteobacteria bacterium]NDK17497.1 hemolysin III family protein [Flavobacteriales bacterium]OIO12186.1 MAG: hemolysin D [Flavobacteriaceae bacterium CG1_02_35_72]PIR12527.1 MAG: hemolysin D [Flavobacteriales bacterium CG11_big_fil_rev_8_21_14_0_20_35_7]PIV17781.1 MAG: hemolysin D [Flavobacteriales bacterium CG03_land_8_20_14_0_80_35_15]PIX07683.1 MAG: hemolysin D [Flavobacteriales bacterium CG_4_8_14_3_um_filter_35_10]PJA06024.1 MAG: hemolysin D [Flavobac
MNSQTKVTYYPPFEEKLNVISHGIGFLLSIAALVLLVVYASIYGTVWHVVSYSIYGGSLILLYLASTLYHSAKRSKLRGRLQIFDHAAIYILIAGTYTPFTLVTLNGTTGWIMFGITWAFALTGIILKIIFTGRFNLLSTIMYVFMGWIVVLAIKPLIHNLPFEGLMWLFAGGIFYTIGAVLYSIKSIKYNHAIFHIFVLAGSFCHFMAIFFYVLP